jgi:hypothetical protein
MVRSFRAHAEAAASMRDQFAEMERFFDRAVVDREPLEPDEHETLLARAFTAPELRALSNGKADWRLLRKLAAERLELIELRKLISESPPTVSKRRKQR